jgi:hypothetical protein
MIELRRVQNALMAPRAEISLELAHCYWEPETFQERFAIEFGKSIEVARDLKLLSPTKRVSVSILLDDKRLKSENKEDWLTSQISEMGSIFQHIDYVVFETELITRLKLFYNAIQPEKRSAKETEIERYVRMKRLTACSHDIAIWHTMRSGALGSTNLPVYAICNRDLPSNSLVPSFCASRVVSILNQADRQHEEQAENDLLKYVRADQFDWRSVERNYYY